MGILILKIRWPVGRLIFNMGNAIPSKMVFLIETAPSFVGIPYITLSHPTNDISIEFDNSVKLCNALVHNIFSWSQRKFCTCHDIDTVVTCAKFCCDQLSTFLNQSIPNFDWISNLIKISLVGWMPDQDQTLSSTLKPLQNGCYFVDNIFRCIFFDENHCILINISPKIVP